MQQTRVSLLRHDCEQTWLKLRLAMGDSDTKCRQEFATTLESLAQELFPSTSPELDSTRYEYLHNGFWRYFDPTHEYYCPIIIGYDKEDKSPDTVEYDWEFKRESSDSSDWSSLFIDREREQHMKQRYDEFWKNVGFRI